MISSWSALLAYVKTALAHEAREQFRVLFLDKKNALVADEILNRGTVDHAPVYPREVMRRALELSASAVILVHNHPGGDPTPSVADVDMTKQVVEAVVRCGSRCTITWWSQGMERRASKRWACCEAYWVIRVEAVPT